MYNYNDYPKRVYAFDPRVDLKEVDSSGVVNLREAFVNGAVDGDVVINDEHFNGCQNPDTLMPRAKDWFERTRQSEYVKSALRAAKSETEPVTPSGETN